MPAWMTLPIVLTLSRVVLLPLFLMMFIRGDAVGYAACFGLLALCEASDALDGAVARRRNQTSPLGMLLDPMADTITRFCMFLGLLSKGLLPLWMAVLLFFRDMSVAYLRSLAATRGIVMAARWSGKVKAVVQAGALFLICVALLFRHQHAFGLATPAGMVLIASSAVGLIGPLVFALVLRLNRSLIVAIAGFTVVLLIPIAALLLRQVPLPQIEWLIPFALWITILVTLYSLYDYVAGFIGGTRATKLPAGA